jgi:hypothetical protein
MVFATDAIDIRAAAEIVLNGNEATGVEAAWFLQSDEEDGP